MPRLLITLLVAFVLLAGTARAQAPRMMLPDASQAASVTQRVGLTELTVRYHRPAVRQRAIWGALVPYGEVWRAGANENTVLTLSSPATIGGVLVPAGSYGLHMIPGASRWTVILSRESTAWGSFFYDEKRDAARFAVRPRPAGFQEHLAYTFDDPSATGVTLALRWEKLEVPIGIEVDTPAVVTENLRQQLHGLSGFYWQSFASAALWCAEHDTNLEQAGAWADRAVGMERNFQTLRAKALVLERTGATTEAEALRAEGLRIATESQLNAYGYELLGAGEVDKAIEAFEQNVARHPGSWNVYDSLGEALAAAGRAVDAAAQYRRALSLTEHDTQKQRIRTILARLGATD